MIKSRKWWAMVNPNGNIMCVRWTRVALVNWITGQFLYRFYPKCDESSRRKAWRENKKCGWRIVRAEIREVK